MILKKMLKSMFFLVLLLKLFINVTLCVENDRSFEIDYLNNRFLMNGRPFQYYSGSFHYFRTPPELWRDRFVTMKYSGLNAVQTYIEWSTVEPKKGQYDSDQINDIINFIKIAQETGLFVILRPGPYICAERDFGGFPVWLQWEKNIEYRTNNTVFMKYVERYFSVLLPHLIPYLFENGGPIIMVQIENEYGSFPTSTTPEGMAYKLFVRDLMKKYLSDKVLLFTTDGHYPGFVQRGIIPGVYPTIDFGTTDNVTLAIRNFRKIQPNGPLVNSEFYTGWLDHWSEEHSKVNTSMIINSLKAMHEAQFNVNFYMFHGGTNFGFRTGANYDKNFTPDPTSYDYDAPIKEDGSFGEKLIAIRDFIKKHKSENFQEPEIKMNLPKIIQIPKVRLHPVGNIFDYNFLPLTRKIRSKLPLTFEDVELADGFILYTTNLDFVGRNFTLNIPKLSDRALIYINQEFKGKLSRTLNATQLEISLEGIAKGRKLQILVENQGRIGFGDKIGEKKGILSNVTINDSIQTEWNQSTLYDDWNKVFDHVRELLPKTKISRKNIPTFFNGKFTVPVNASSTYLSFKSGPWHKGIVFINGHNLGRYWPFTGPQKTLFIPGAFLYDSPKTNDISILELQNSNCSNNECFVDFVDKPEIDSKVQPD